MWEEVYPNLKFWSPTRRDALHDSENGFHSQFGAERVTKGWSFDGASMVRKKKGIATWEREGEKLLNFFGWVSKERENMAFSLKRLFLLTWLMLCHMKRKIWPFEIPKSCLGLRAISLVLVPRVSLHPSGPVSESRQYVYQNTQNETLSVVQRLVLFNFKLHAKRWFLH